MALIRDDVPEPLTMSPEDAGQRLTRFMEAMGAGAEEEIPGVLRVRVDSHMQVSEVEILDYSIEPELRERLEVAVRDAINGARSKVVAEAGKVLGGRGEAPT